MRSCIGLADVPVAFEPNIGQFEKNISYIARTKSVTTKFLDNCVEIFSGDTLSIRFGDDISSPEGLNPLKIKKPSSYQNTEKGIINIESSLYIKDNRIMFEKVIVNSDKELTFIFKNGLEIKRSI